ncbi:HNH endonuclease [Janthinobacterium sp. GW460P]|uniref:HNH endonuclease n=1 Tax=unclassified Janthinobacterium TaxID=2610881 RepID=UPI000A321834|nr:MULTISPECIES: HNH endonuclease signature motif containing protein [unclassified Janthinobacterium]MCC7703364.1 HNH endonuclease [Janthinobacterium sp. GW460P]MCC7708871.1 HNH endonuclease [Janthinobacterium sp. GW460W]
MALYNLQIKWLKSTETITLDTLALPEQGSVINTSEVWPGKNSPLCYQVEVLRVAQKGSIYTFILRYDESANVDLAGVNVAWGQSTVVLDLSEDTPSATATWKNWPADAYYDGEAERVGVTQEPSLLSDLINIDSSGLTPTEKEILVAARIGQGKFRSTVISAWKIGEVCCLTGIDIPELLIASHIKPWCESNDDERRDPANGLILATHVDKLFDKHLLSFKPREDDYVVVLSPRVRAVAEELGINNAKTINAKRLGSAESHFSAYMQGHHKRFLEKVINDGFPQPPL